MNSVMHDRIAKILESRRVLSEDLKPQGEPITLKEIKSFLFAGAAIFTLEFTDHETDKPKHYTYRVSKTPKSDFKGDPKKKVEYFVGVLAGPDNTSSYQYMGLLRRDIMKEIPLRYEFASHKFKGETNASRVFENFFISATEFATMPAGISFQLAGKCGRCGRTLTDPESIRRGIGPECFGKLGG